jgi:hypothetical protein
MYLVPKLRCMAATTCQIRNMETNAQKFGISSVEIGISCALVIVCSSSRCPLHGGDMEFLRTDSLCSGDPKGFVPKMTTCRSQHARFVFPLLLLPELLEDADYFKLQARNHTSGSL